MKPKWKWKSPFVWPRQGSDLFKRTQNRLTLQYTAVLIAFLALFIGTVYGLLYFLLINDQKNQLNDWIQDMSYAFHESMEHTGSYNIEGNLGSSYPSLANQTVGCFKDPHGNFLYEAQQRMGLSAAVGSAVAEWTPEGDQTEYKTVTIKETGRDAGPPRHGNDPRKTAPGNVRMLLAGKAVYDNGVFIGTLYVAKEVGSQYRLFGWLLLVLIGLALLFCVLAVFLSRNMSVKAMVPIARSYTRQREFVADASHELRTPLSVILSSIEVLEMENSLKDDPFSRRVLDNMREEAKRMTDLSSHLLTLARSDSDEVQLSITNFDLAAEASRTMASLLPLAQAKQITLKLHAEDGMTVHGDAQRLQQLMVILLDNAIKYTPEGGTVSLALEIREDKRRMLHMTVSDNGIGIPPEELPHIFERFYRVDKSRARELGGHGLGLSIGRWIAEAHGGTLSVQSTPGQGSTFTAVIPC
ncbi:sensor histidine kinase [Paenibacillus cellulositrophicus]|uniref:sensor histidine kinase n=1 Tax=Paenibacillus cellulositrophicus TaxID=562959 RepID=UPI003F814069